VDADAVTPREAATVMIVRDAPHLEAFMLRRNPRSSFVAGAHVFPGGQVDAADGAPELIDDATGSGPAAADAALGQVGATRFWVAAVREAFEEAGVLLARRLDGTAFVPTSAEQQALAKARSLVASGHRPLRDVLTDHGLVLDLGALVPIGRWITPVPSPKRFDTWFFVALAPEGHQYEHDARELVDSEWLTPYAALDRARSGAIELIYPTIRSLLLAQRYPDASAFVAAARRRWDHPEPFRVMNPGQGWQLDLTTDDEHEVDDRASGFVMGMQIPLGAVVPAGGG